MTFHPPPGATPIDDLSDLKIPIITQTQLDAAEFDNIFKAEQKYFRPKKIKNLSWFKPKVLQHIHYSMFDDVWHWAGKYRRTNVLPVGVEPYKIPILIVELCQDVEFWVKNMPLLEAAARIHHRLAWIHPFPNGNGRFSRFISNLVLFSYRHPLPVWPTGLNRESSRRTEYLDSLRDADKGDFKPLLNYLISLGAKSY